MRNSVHMDIAATDKTGRAFASAKRSLGSLSKSAASATRSMAGIFGATLGVAALTRLISSAIEYGSAITDAAAATRVGIEEYQVLKFAAEEAGAGMDKVTTALAKIQKATNDAKNGLTTYKRAFDSLGINLEKFQKLSPDRQFESLGKAMVGSKDQAVAYASILDIIGSRNAPRLMEVLQRLGTEGFDAVADAARNAGQIMDEHYAQRLDAAADSLARFKTRMSVISGEIVTFWMDAADGLNPWEEKINEGANAMKANLTPAMRELVELQETQQRVAASGATAMAEHLSKEIDAKIAAMLATKDQTAAQEELNAAFDAAGGDASEKKMERIAKFVRQISESSASPATNIAVLEDEVSALHETILKFDADGLHGTEAWADAYLSALEQSIKLEKLRGAEIKKNAQSQAEAMKILNQMSDEGSVSMDDVFAAMEESVPGTDAIKDWTDANLTAHQMLVHSMQNASDSMTDSFMSFIETGELNFKSFVSSILSDMSRMVFQQGVANPFTQALTGVFGGGKAVGGPVASGTTYLVGEKGPELFTPNSSSAYLARESVISCSSSTSAKSRTRLSNLSAILGVPLLRLAISEAASIFATFSNLCEACITILHNSSGV